MQFSLLSIFSFILSLTCLTLVIFLTFFAKTKLQKILLLLNLCVSIWGIGLTFIGIKTLSLDNVLIWWKIAHSGGILISVVFMHLMLELCEVKKREILISVAYFQAIIFIILDWLNRLGYDLNRVFSSFYYVRASSIVYVIMSTLWLFCMFYGLYVVIKSCVNKI